MQDSPLHLSKERAAKSLVQFAALNPHPHARCEDDLDDAHASGAIAQAHKVRCRCNRYGQKCCLRLLRIERSGTVTRSPVVQAAAANAVLLGDRTNRCAFAKTQFYDAPFFCGRQMPTWGSQIPGFRSSHEYLTMMSVSSNHCEPHALAQDGLQRTLTVGQFSNPEVGQFWKPANTRGIGGKDRR